MIVHWHNENFECDTAVRGYDFVTMYDANLHETGRITNIIGPEWQHIHVTGGEWSDPSAIPTEMDKVRADIDYLSMLIDEE